MSIAGHTRQRTTRGHEASAILNPTRGHEARAPSKQTYRGNVAVLCLFTESISHFQALTVVGYTSFCNDLANHAVEMLFLD